MSETSYPRLGETVFRRTLSNGMEVIVVHKPYHAKASAFFATHYGGMDMRFQKDGQWLDTPAGIAHYLEHKMFDTEEGDAMNALAQNGAVCNAFTSASGTVYYFESTENFYKNLDILLRFVSIPYFTQESVDKERGIISQEIRMGEDDPDYKIYADLLKCLYASPAYNTSVAGTVESIQEITPETLYDCHKVFYTPGNMALVCVGNVDIDRVAEIAEEILPRESGPAILRDHGTETPLPVQKELVEHMDVSMPQFLLGYKCRPCETGEEILRRATIGDIASDVLFGTSSPLFTRLYEEGLNNGSLGGGISLQPGTTFVSVGGEAKDPHVIVEEIQKAIRDYSENGVPDALYEQIRRANYGQFIRSLNSFESIAVNLSDGVFDGYDYFRLPEIFDTVTKKDVEDFIRQELVPEHAAISLILPLNEEDADA